MTAKVPAASQIRPFRELITDREDDVIICSEGEKIYDSRGVDNQDSFARDRRFELAERIIGRRVSQVLVA